MLVYTCRPHLTITGSLLDSQKCPSFDDKLYSHSRLRELDSLRPLMPPSSISTGDIQGHFGTMALKCLIPEMSHAILTPFRWPDWCRGLVCQDWCLPRHPGWGGESDMGMLALNDGLKKCFAPTLFLPTLSLEAPGR